MKGSLKEVVLLMVIVVAFNSCKKESLDTSSSRGQKIFELLSPDKTGISFKNMITETEENNHLQWESIYNGGGVGIADINNDGLPDILLTGNMTADKLYLNKGNMQFEDITQAAGIDEQDWSSGVTFADVNNDGFLDIYICKMSWYKDDDNVKARTNKCYINNGNLTFTEEAKQLGIADVGHSTQASFFDYNKDGILDLYVMNAPSHRFDQKLSYMDASSISYEMKGHLYKGNGRTFEDVTMVALGDHPHAYGLGLVTLDLNQDGWTDIYVANDFEKPDLMLINQKDGTFKNEIQDHLRHISYSSMGMDVADINNDRLYDIGVLDMQTNDHVRSKTNMPSMDTEQFWRNVGSGYHFQFMNNMIQLNNGLGYYSEIAQKVGIASTDWSWSLLMADFDQDAYRDIIITNGINRNIKDNDFNIMMQNQRANKGKSLLELAMETKVEKVANFAYRNSGAQLGFEDVSKEWGFDFEGFSYGAAHGDLDMDGDLDVVVNNNNDVAQIYQNNVSNTSYLQVRPVKGKLPDFNAQVTIKADDTYQIAEVHPVRGYQASSEAMAHFGLPKKVQNVDVAITFSNGKTHLIENVKSNQILTVDIDEANGKSMQQPDLKQLITEVSDLSGIEYFHVENPYNDFTQQVLLPHMQSRNGPFMTTGDVNGDGREDLYIGASKGDFGVIYVQDAQGKMRYIKSPDMITDQVYEDMGAAFFDIDNDGDLDLYVVSGGSEDPEGSPAYLDRLYINDGRGVFTRVSQPLPSNNGSVVVPLDINKDGWMDLFVGGRGEGQRYPYPGHSHLLMNVKGQLALDTSFVGKRMGMVTDAVAADINNDGWIDLAVVGEWMKPKILINEQKKLEDHTTKYIPEGMEGWWYHLQAEDLDGDGQLELICGNMGLNNKYKASAEKPIKVYGADFDKNNKYDIVLSKNSKYGEVPVRGFQCSSEQLPDLKKKFDSYSDFAHAKLDEIIDVDPNTLQLQANEFRSGYLKMNNGKYKFMPFPNRAQLSVVQASGVFDINGDGLKDLLLCGNHFDAEVETVRHDASVGLVMLQSKDGSFNALSPIESGFYAAGNVKDAVLCQLAGRPHLIVANNSYKAQVFKVGK